jgi:hypothetical protein
MKKMNLFEPDLIPLKDFINFLSYHRKKLLLIVTISHFQLSFIKFIAVNFAQLPERIRLLNRFEALVELLAKELILAKQIILEALLVH